MYRSLLLISLLVLSLRLPLWLLPGPGRDEAAYHYWSHHFEPAFAPLMQLAVRVFEVPFGQSLLALRAPVLLLGGLVLLLHDVRLRRAGTPGSARFVALMAIASTPWQSYSGSILHPDNFLLVSLLALVIAAQDGRVLLTATAALLAALSKPTGILVLPVVWWLLGRMRTAQPVGPGRHPARSTGTHSAEPLATPQRTLVTTVNGPSRPAPSSRRRDSDLVVNQARARFLASGWVRLLAGRGILLLAAVPLLATIDTGFLSGIGEFGRISPEVPVWQRAGAWGMAFLFLAGPVLPLLAARGCLQRVRLLRAGGASPERREAVASLAIAAVMLGFFLTAAAVRGQFKANWILPATVLLLPLGTIRLPRSLLVTGLALALTCSAAQTILLTHPNLAAAIEARLPGRGTPGQVEGVYSYPLHAGVREASVSSSRNWRDRFAEYQGCERLARDLEQAWQAGPGRSVSPRWIVSDDYGLAAQLHWHLGDDALRIAVPGDRVFRRTMRDLIGTDTPEPLLVIPVRSGSNLARSGIVDGPVDGWVGGPVDGWVDGPVDGQVDGPHGEPPAELWNLFELGTPLGSFRHPTTGTVLTPRVAHLSSGNPP